MIIIPMITSSLAANTAAMAARTAAMNTRTVINTTPTRRKDNDIFKGPIRKTTRPQKPKDD